jgi:hypothetical protein
MEYTYLPRSYRPDPRRPTKRFTSWSKSRLFCHCRSKATSRFSYLMFLSTCLFVLALAAINSLTSNSYATASDQRGIHTNAESMLPESKSDSSSLPSQIFYFFRVTGNENNCSCSQETSVGKWNFISHV